MTNELQTFDFNGNALRGLLIDGEPWLVGKDVATALGYAKPENAIANHVAKTDKTSTLIQGTGSNYKSKTTLINESGFYSLVLGSKLPTAQEFKHWVTSSVLPSIRKTGGYIMGEEFMDEDELILKAHEILLRKVEAQRKRIKEMEPKAAYHDNVLACKNVESISVIAKDYGKSAVWLNEYLHEKGIQYKQGKTRVLYAQYADCGYTATRTHTPLGKDGKPLAVAHTYWTQKGRRFIHDLLKADGIIPTYEREELAATL